MLVVKDESKLEKYGFIKGTRYNGTTYYEYNSKKNKLSAVVDMNKYHNFQIYCFTMDLQDTVYDMIKDGVVVKEEYIKPQSLQKTMIERMEYLEKVLKENGIMY